MRGVGFIINILLTSSIQAQTNPPNAAPVLPTKPLSEMPDRNPNKWATELTFTDHMGRPFRDPYTEIAGSPFYFDDWKNAVVTTGSGVLNGFKKFKLDLFNQEIDFLNDNNDSLILREGIVQEFTLFDSALTGNTYHFRSGFPDVDKNNGNTFYQVLADGPLLLLKASRKEIVVNKNDLNGETTKEFVLYESYYVFNKGEMLRMKKDKDFVLILMMDQKEKMEDFLKRNKVNYKNIESLVPLFKHYNNLIKGA